MENKGNSAFQLIVIIMLTLCTFFLGSIWCSLKQCGNGSGKMFCPIGKSGMSEKICPITGKTLEASK